jgi:cysteine desulfurase
MKIYFDNAATTPLEERVLDAMLPFMKSHYGNPSSVHAQGRMVRTAIEKTRKKVAALLNASPSEIFFTSGGTEADNTAIFCAIESHGIKHAITSPIEHHAVIHPLEECAKKGLIQLSFLQVDHQGVIDLDHLKELLKTHPQSLVSIMQANNEIGNIIDLDSIGHLCKEYGAFFHSDTVQTVGHFAHDLSNTMVDATAGSAHKFHGPKGAGFLFVKKNKKIHPFIHGGAQERNMRGGTENVYGIIGLAKALEIAYEGMFQHRSHIEALKKHFITSLKDCLPGVQFNGLSGEMEKSLYTVLNVSLPPSPENRGMVLFNLDLQGIAVSGGSACSSGAVVGSHVLRSLNHPPERDAIRFSFSRFNTMEEVDYTVAKLKELYAIKA